MVIESAGPSSTLTAELRILAPTFDNVIPAQHSFRIRACLFEKK
jgi:hypothetical protein